MVASKEVMSTTGSKLCAHLQRHAGELWKCGRDLCKSENQKDLLKLHIEKIIRTQ